MRREAEGSAPELIGPAIRPQFNAENRQEYSLNETLSLDITTFCGWVLELIILTFRLGIPKTKLDGATLE